MFAGRPRPRVSIGNGCRPGILCPVPGTQTCLEQTANTCVQLTNMSSYGIVWCVVLRQHSRHMQFSVCQILSLLMTFPLKTFQFPVQTPVDLSQEEHKTTATCFTCKHCNDKGHLAKDCPNIRGEYQEYLQMKNIKNTKDNHVEELDADVPGKEREDCHKEDKNIEQLENSSSVDFLLIDNSDEEEVESSCLENVQVTRINGEETKNGDNKEDDRITNNSEDNESRDVIRTAQKRQRYIHEFYIYDEVMCTGIQMSLGLPRDKK